MRLTHPHAVAAGLSGADRLLGPTVALSVILLVLAWTLPLMTVDRLIVLREEVSIVEAIWILGDEGEYLLFAILLLFTIIFPVAKLSVAALFLYRLDPGDRRLRRWLGLADAFGRWSMLDVFVVALAVVAIKLSLVSDVTVHAGVYVFVAAVALSMIAVRRITVLVHRAADAPAPLTD